jgi:pimeloyl-ACP methyl ester carboxylesterase
VVVPALPGFPFAPPLTTPGMSANRIAGLLADALGQLGYDRYTLSAGDVGGIVAEILAAEYPGRVTSLHLTNVALRRAATADLARLAPDASGYPAQAGQWSRANGGFVAEQSTRPNTLAVALGDSPAGLAAWIAEKMQAWSGEGAFTPDDILTWIAAYWTTGTIATSFATYVEPPTLAPYLGTPTVLSVFADDFLPAPRSYAEEFVDIREYVEYPVGGHFAAWEQPEAYAADVRRAIALDGGVNS